jgi:hypothetical protein
MIQDLSGGCANAYPVHDVYIFADSARQSGVIICDHDFVAVIDSVPSASDGWHGFLLDYHCGSEPWKDSPWEVRNLAEFIEQFEAGLASAPESVDKSKITKLLNFLRQAHKEGEKVFLECR